MDALDIGRAAQLDTRPGSTIERDVLALIYFFNRTCTASQADIYDVFNPYRGAFAQVSQWREQKGWRSIVEAHSSVRVRCRALYMEGGEEFVAKHCFWNIHSIPFHGVNGTGAVYPTPRWTIIEDCCERLNRPLLKVNDAIWATTRGATCRFLPTTGRSLSLTPVRRGWARLPPAVGTVWHGAGRRRRLRLCAQGDPAA